MKENIITIAKKALAIESEALVELNKYIDASFEKAVTAILNSKGRLVISGIGKSAIIAQKMVATFNSTGTPALYLHAAEAIHGVLHQEITIAPYVAAQARAFLHAVGNGGGLAARCPRVLPRPDRVSAALGVDATAEVVKPARQWDRYRTTG
jgi:hypothetical protein